MNPYDEQQPERPAHEAPEHEESPSAPAPEGHETPAQEQPTEIPPAAAAPAAAVGQEPLAPTGPAQTPQPPVENPMPWWSRSVAQQPQPQPEQPTPGADWPFGAAPQPTYAPPFSQTTPFGAGPFATQPPYGQGAPGGPQPDAGGEQHGARKWFRRHPKNHQSALAADQATLTGEHAQFAGDHNERTGERPARTDEQRAARKRFRRGAALTAAAVVISAAATGTVVHVVDDHSASATTAATTAQTQTDASNLPPAAQLSSSVKSALAKIEPSVVIINDTVNAAPNGRGGFGGSGGFGGFGGFEESGAGTGIIISADGEVVTNAHVVNGASSIKVTLPNNGGTHSASIVGMNTQQDLAVIKIDGVSGLTPATFADSDTVQVGDAVIAVGNALGYGGSPTVTEGIVSATDRSLQDSTSDMSDLLQTDAAINPGNSGGPLVDANGDVIGINVAVATGSQNEPAQNIGFSIPSNTVVKALPALKAGQSSTGDNQSTAYLGVEITDANNGAGVVAVDPNSPASAAGLQSGDVVTKFNDTTITDGADLQKAVRGEKPGTKVTLTIDRGGATKTLTVTLGTIPSLSS